MLLDAGTPVAARHVPLIAREGLDAIHVHEKVRVGLLILEDTPGAPPPSIVAALLRSVAEGLGEAHAGAGVRRALRPRHRARAGGDARAVRPGGDDRLHRARAEAIAVATTLVGRGLEWTLQDVRVRPLGALQTAQCGGMPVVALSRGPGRRVRQLRGVRLAPRPPPAGPRPVAARRGLRPDRRLDAAPQRLGLLLREGVGQRSAAAHGLAFQRCKRRDSASAIAEASGLAWRPLDLSLHRDADVALLSVPSLARLSPPGVPARTSSDTPP